MSPPPEAWECTGGRELFLGLTPPGYCNVAPSGGLGILRGRDLFLGLPPPGCCNHQVAFIPLPETVAAGPDGRQVVVAPN